MSRLIGKELTEGLRDRLSGRNVTSHEGKIIPIFTLDESGWPQPALLSYYEVVAKDPTTIDMALWKNSSAAKNLARTNKITIMITDRGVNYYLKGRVKKVQAEIPGLPGVSRFCVGLEQLLEDQEPTAEITSGLTYRCLSNRESDDIAAKVLQYLREA